MRKSINSIECDLSNSEHFEDVDNWPSIEATDQAATITKAVVEAGYKGVRYLCYAHPTGRWDLCIATDIVSPEARIISGVWRFARMGEQFEVDAILDALVDIYSELGLPLPKNIRPVKTRGGK